MRTRISGSRHPLVKHTAMQIDGQHAELKKQNNKKTRAEPNKLFKIKIFQTKLLIQQIHSLS